MKIKVFQKGFNYSQDGAGNRLVYHLQGCNMRCPWCANPEGLELKGALVVDQELLLENVCPFGAISSKQLNRVMCESCEWLPCVRQNRSKGLRLSFEDIEIDEIINEVKRSSALFYDGGGVTLSGGEPTLQFSSVKFLFEELKQLDIHTAIETNGTHPKLGSLFPLIDMLIMDFKHYDDAVCARVTGIGNSQIKLNIIDAFSNHKNVLIRIPVIHCINDSEQDIRNFAIFFKQYQPGNASFEFLPYHEYGKSKWFQCGMPYLMENAHVGQETIALFESVFRDYGLRVIHT